MPPEVNIERLIEEHSALVASQMSEIAASAQSEEDVRHETNKLIDEFRASAGIEVKGQHEYGLAGGWVDSKYGGVIIEYKYPGGAGRISADPNAPGTRAVVEKIRQRFRDFQTEERIEPGRLFAAGCDARMIVFVRHRGGRFEVETPQPVTRHTVERLLRALVSLGARGLSFTPEHLAAHFGADSRLAHTGIRDIYLAITETDSPKAKTFFRQWKTLFGQVCGYDVEGKNEKIRKLGEHYALPKARPAELLFSVHTYYAIFMKFLAAEIASTFSPLGVSVLKKCVAAPTRDSLLREMSNLEQGGIWTQLGITNFLEADLFSWYLAAWDERMAGVVRGIVRKLDEYDATTLSVEPTESRDLLKKLYLHLFPKSVRHDLGEYYTPDWLADYVLNELEYEGDPDKRLLDPACGSGTFLVMAINRVRAWFGEHRDQCGYGEEELVQKILSNVIGFDLNPLAVMAARTNYLLAIRDLLKFAGGVELPVYLCDSVVTPAEYGALFTPGDEAVRKVGAVKALKTAVGKFHIPAEVSTSPRGIAKYADTLESCVRNRYDADQFISRCEAESLPVAEAALHRELYEKLRKLDADNRNGIWARIIKNAFAPLFVVGTVDYVAGNPPWVNWESLPGEYRDDMKPLWETYGLFSLSGMAGRLGGGKKDLAMLFVYACVDYYLRQDGGLGFVITQTVFKTRGAGDGFRKFRFKVNERPEVHLVPRRVTDMSDLQPFEAAANRTAVFVCEKSSEPLRYPVPYEVWSKSKPTTLFSAIDSKVEYGGTRSLLSFSAAEDLADVRAAVSVAKMAAVPVIPGNRTSPWLTVPEAALPAIQKVVGASAYRAYEGVNTGGLNGCYWVRVLQRRPDGNLLVENLHDAGKIKVEQVQKAIEPDLVYPLLRGRDVSRWRAAPSAQIVLAQDPATRTGIPEAEMRLKHPKTFAYLEHFRGQLRKRASTSVRALMEKGAFYSMFAVGPYTVAPWKVMWPEVGETVRAGVSGPDPASPGKPALPDHTIVAVSCETREEAHFICALLNSAPAQAAITGYVVLHPSPHVLEHIRIPRFSRKNTTHVSLAALSEECHAATARGAADAVRALESEIDNAAARLWGITAQELAALAMAHVPSLITD
jgi:hypothetical protein